MIDEIGRFCKANSAFNNDQKHSKFRFFSFTNQQFLEKLMLFCQLCLDDKKLTSFFSFYF